MSLVPQRSVLLIKYLLHNNPKIYQKSPRNQRVSLLFDKLVSISEWKFRQFLQLALHENSEIKKFTSFLREKLKRIIRKKYWGALEPIRYVKNTTLKPLKSQIHAKYMKRKKFLSFFELNFWSVWIMCFKLRNITQRQIGTSQTNSDLSIELKERLYFTGLQRHLEARPEMFDASRNSTFVQNNGTDKHTSQCFSQTFTLPIMPFQVLPVCVNVFRFAL